MSVVNENVISLACQETLGTLANFGPQTEWQEGADSKLHVF